INGGYWVLGVVGQLQFDVIAARLKDEYGVQGRFEGVAYRAARWVEPPTDMKEDSAEFRNFLDKNRHNLAEDVYGALTYLAPNDWHLQRIQDDFPQFKFVKTREHQG
ncbi:MAG: peptide chain release factor 3, partial [Alphaproteobacteria bacterium]|nr:peptide chain release factor 3 [Alphaproteobacteria bacterium]